MRKLRKFLRRILPPLALAFVLPSVVWGWSIGELNKTINQTNFIVDSRCSGTLIDLEHQLILTNHHCIRHKVREFTTEEVVDGRLEDVRRERLLDVSVEQKAYDGYEQVGSSEYVTEIVAKDKSRDLALLQLKAQSIPHSIESALLPEGVPVTRGETAYAVGNPRMLDASVTKGIVSSVTRQFRVPWADNEKVAFYQFDGGIVGGNSGGALYNEQGQLIGVPAAGAESTVGLAIPASTVRTFLLDNCWPVWDNAMMPEECEDYGEPSPADDE